MTKFVHPSVDSDVLEPFPGLKIHCLYGAFTSYAVVRNGKCLLVECHSPNMDKWLAHRGIPSPELILHTHVQPHHCMEGDLFPSARIMVPLDLAELASDPQKWRKDSRTVWENPADWGITFGQERYGLAGSISLYPPAVPLKLSGTFAPGDVIEWQDLRLHVVKLQLHGPYSVGFIVEHEGRRILAFIGDLFRSPACFDTLHDMEINYAGTFLPKSPALLQEAASWGVELFLPSTGPAILDGPRQARELAAKVEDYLQSLNWTTGKFTPPAQPTYPSIGRYLKIDEGIYQITGFGNCILFIDKQGRGLMVDPGPCDYESADRREKFVVDLELLEKEAGLKTIEVALITHIHGDHYDMTPLVQKRYPGCRVAAWDLVAKVMESPWDYPYPALIPWYNIGLEYVHVDDILTRSKPYYWNDIRIDSGHLPGHCHPHAVYFLTFSGKRIAITGDTIQTRGGSDTLFFAISNDSVPNDVDGCIAAYRLMAKHTIDLNLGGHGSSFTQCNANYTETLARMHHVQPYLRALVHEGDLTRACRRPWYPALRPVD